MEERPQIRFPRLASNIDEALSTTYKHNWTFLHYVIILGTFVPLLALACSVTVVNYTEITRTYSRTAFIRSYSVDSPKLCNKLTYYYYYYIIIHFRYFAAVQPVLKTLPVTLTKHSFIHCSAKNFQLFGMY